MRGILETVAAFGTREEDIDIIVRSTATMSETAAYQIHYLVLTRWTIPADRLHLIEGLSDDPRILSRILSNPNSYMTDVVSVRDRAAERSDDPLWAMVRDYAERRITTRNNGGR